MKDDTNVCSAAELRLLEAVREQGVCDFADGADITAEEMTSWGPERIVRAALLGQLLTAEKPNTHHMESSCGAPLSKASSTFRV